MGLLDGIEKLINEHGSAAILRERIALANDQYAVLERKLSESESKVQNLEAQNQTLRCDNDQLAEQILILKKPTDPNKHISPPPNAVAKDGTPYRSAAPHRVRKA